MAYKHTLKYWHSKRDHLLRKLASIGPLVDGSLVTIARKCDSPGCKCARGEKHVSRYLTNKAPSEDGAAKRMKTKTVYVPVALEEQVRAWADEHQRLKKISQGTCQRPEDDYPKLRQRERTWPSDMLRINCH